MTPTVVDRVLRWRERGIGKGADRNAHAARYTFLRVKDIGAAHGAETEAKACALIARSDILGGATGNSVRRGEARDGCEDAAGALLTGETVTDTDDSGLTLDVDAKLSAMARRGAE